MKKDFKKKWLWATVFSCGAILLCGMGSLVYQPENAKLLSFLFAPRVTEKISVYCVSMNGWIAHHKAEFNKNLATVKQATIVKENAEQDIHFEFYSALQDMQVTLPEKDKSPVNKRPVVAKATGIFDADKLQNALNDEFSQIQKKNVK